MGATVAAVEPLALRRTLAGFATGVVVVATHQPGMGNVGLTVNSFATVSLEPPLVLWCLRKSSRLLGAFVRSGKFSVSALTEFQLEPCNHFASREPGKRVDGYFRPGAQDVPVLREANAGLVCRVKRHFEEGDHVVFIGEVLEAFSRAEPAGPLVFFGGRFHHALPMG
ncbi:flavin reductase family protein [Azohydromonas lata]|uniref:flavin reductase family protein n=1 Tax=Azohydromonas lata TaxID=45677 RepID=UPI001471D5AF|nr:flavin reductase family protein [Azohydromonas lata]